MKETPVLIVGGGLVGLSTSVFLSWHGVPSTLVERHPTTSIHPRARGINVRTMELLRGVGLENEIRGSANARALAANTGIVMAESLAGPEASAFQQSYMKGPAESFDHLSPTGWCLCDQDEAEPILRRQATELGGSLHFGTEMVEFADDVDSVVARIRDVASGQEGYVRARYLVAADGVDSPVRRKLGIPVTGLGTLGSQMSIYFRADLRAVLGERRFIMCYIKNSDVAAALLPINNTDRWLLHVPYRGDFDTSPGNLTRLVRAAVGVPSLDVSIVGALPWDAAARVASEFRQGRVFLAGDAAHVMPPSGAFGSNTGVHDAHNLAWKLAYVLRGVACEDLLDSYDAERRPVAEFTVEQATLRSKDRPRADKAGGEMAASILPDPVVALGYRYSALGGEAADAPYTLDFTAAPGNRAPHVWLERSGQRLSTLDLIGRTPLVLAGQDCGWRTAVETVSARRRLSIAFHQIGEGGLKDIDGGWAQAYGVGDGGAVLIRPDGFVAWRAASAPPQPADALDRAVAQMLGRQLLVA